MERDTQRVFGTSISLLLKASTWMLAMGALSYPAIAQQALPESTLAAVDLVTTPAPETPRPAEQHNPMGALLSWSFRPTILFLGDRAEQRTILSTGTCSLIIDPDRARVSVVATGASASPGEAVASAQQRADAIQTAVEAIGLADLEVHMNLPRTENDGDERTPSYVVDIVVEFVTSSIARTGEAEEAIRTSGPGLVAHSVRYVSNDRRQAAEGDCLAIASGNARARAERLAAALGTTLGPVMSIVDETLPETAAATRSGKLPGVQSLPALATLDRLVVELSIVVQFALE